MKRLSRSPFAVLFLTMVLVLTACSSIGLPSPSVSSQPTSSQKPIQAEDYAGLLDLVAKAARNQPPYARRYTMASADTDAMRNAEGAPSQAGDIKDYSQTNIQVEGVDEADIIKTDGRYLYLIANSRLYVIDAADPAQLEVVFEHKINPYTEKEKTIVTETPAELFLDIDNQRLVLIVTGSVQERYIPEPEETKPSETEPSETKPEEPDTSEGASSEGSAPDESTTESAGVAADRSIWYPYYNARSYTSVRIYDISNPEAPDLVRQFTQDGGYSTSRKVGPSLYVVSNRYQYRIYEARAEDLKPEEVFPSTCIDPLAGTWTALEPDRITILPDGDLSNQTIMSAFDITDDASEPDLRSLLGSSGQVYASAGYLYIAAWQVIWGGKENSYPTYNTEIYRFKLAGAALSEAGKGSVPGWIINQFSMDEHDGYFRIATTTGDSWSGSQNISKNNLYVLDGSLNVAGKLTGLAPGETIKSVRFMGSQAYVVTFRTVDPLFVIDLADPRTPKVLGELKIPGYSTYLHPYDENLLLGFGYDVLTEGEDRVFNLGLKVSLFDISDFNQPREVSTFLLGGIGSYADVLYNHKNLLFSREKNLIAFPATLTPRDADDPKTYRQPSYQGLLVLGLDENKQLVLRGHVTHFDKLGDPFGPEQPLNEKEMQAFYGHDAVYRAAWIGNTLLTFSGRQVRAASLDTFSALGKAELPGYDDVSQGYPYPVYRGIMVD